MQTVEAPASVRTQALAIIARAWPPGHQNPKTLLREAGPETVAAILIDLERAFGIDIEADEVWPAATACDVATLVAIKTRDPARWALMPANDPLPVYLPPRLPAHPQDRAHGVRRALKIVQIGVMTSLFAGGLAAMAYGASAFL